MKYYSGKGSRYSEDKALELAGNLLTPENPLSRAMELPIYYELSIREFASCKWAQDQDNREKEFNEVYEPWYNKTFGLEDDQASLYWFCYPSHAINALKSQCLENDSIKKFITNFIESKFPKENPKYQAHIRDMCLRFFSEVCYYSMAKSNDNELVKGVAIKVATKHLYFLSEWYARGDVFKLFSQPAKWPKCFTIAILECLKYFN